MEELSQRAARGPGQGGEDQRDEDGEVEEQGVLT
jgi:hypothetical protein